MRGLLVLGFALLVSSFGRAADPSKIIEGLPFAVPTAVDWQGTLSTLPEQEQQALIDGLHAMFQYVYANAPKTSHLLNKEGLRPSSLTKKRVRLVFTDAGSVTLFPPIGKSETTLPLVYPYPLQNLGVLGGPSRDIFNFIIIVRVDRCLFKSVSDRGFRSDAFVGFTTALAGQLYGYATDLLLELSDADFLYPDLKLNAERALRGRKRSLEIEAEFLDLFLRNGKEKGFPQEQLTIAERYRANVYQQKSSILVTNPRKAGCPEDLRNN